MTDKSPKKTWGLSEVLDLIEEEVAPLKTEVEENKARLSHLRKQMEATSQEHWHTEALALAEDRGGRTSSYALKKGISFAEAVRELTEASKPETYPDPPYGPAYDHKYHGRSNTDIERMAKESDVSYREVLLALARGDATDNLEQLAAEEEREHMASLEALARWHAGEQEDI